MSIKSPIIVFGTGRSGTTVFHRMLAMHPGVSWLSTLCDRFPHRPALNKHLMSCIGIPVLRPLLESRFPPSESYLFWESYARGFSRPCRDLGADDLSLKAQRLTRHALAGCVSPRRPTLLLKITGWPRLAYLSSLFEDAKFIHVIRDGRAVANSLLNVDFWWGWRGPENWRWGPLHAEYLDEWQKSRKSFVVLAAIQWKIHMEAARTSAEALDPTRIMEIRYETMCDEPVDVMRNVCRFANLDWTSEFQARLGKFRLSNKNEKWKSELNENQRTQLEKSLQDALVRYGY